MRMLLKMKVDVNIQAANGATALYEAVEADFTEAALILIAEGGDTNSFVGGQFALHRAVCNRNNKV